MVCMLQTAYSVNPQYSTRIAVARTIGTKLIACNVKYTAANKSQKDLVFEAGDLFTPTDDPNQIYLACGFNQYYKKEQRWQSTP